MDEIRTELLSSKGIGSVLFLDETDRKKIIEFEREDELNGSIICGKKDNVGIRQVLDCDVMMGFLTNKEFQWPTNHIKVMHGDKVIGEDVCNPLDLQEYHDDNKYCVLGNIVILYEEFLKGKSSTDPIYMVINAHPFPSIEVVSGISGALIASPSRASDEYMRSLSQEDKMLHVGSFLIGFNLKPLEYASSLVATPLKSGVY